MTEDHTQPDIYDLLAETPQAEGFDMAAMRARHEAIRCIGVVRASYLDDVARARIAGMDDVARLYDQITRELDRAARIALTGVDPGDGGPIDTTTEKES